MKITFLGHATFLIDNLIIDPFIKGNPQATTNLDDIKCKIICVTHAHEDHLGDTIELAKKNNATIVAIHEIAVYAEKQGVKSVGMNFGGPVDVEGYNIQMVPAWHSSDMGTACGFLITKDGKTIYHAGDTGLFSDMKLIGEEGIDVALLPIGGRYTMDIKQATKACKFLNPKTVIPMHYNSWDIIKADPKEFKPDCEVVVLKSGEDYEV